MIFLYLACGLLAGFLAGLLGIGGGIVIVPALSFLLPYSSIPLDQVMQIAVSTSLACTFVTSSLSLWGHHQKKGILYPLIHALAPGLLLGCVAGSWMTSFLPQEQIRNAFGCLCIFLSIYFFLPKIPTWNLGKHPKRTLPFWGFVIGTLSSMLGIGGGVFTVPTLQGHQIPLKNAIATSAGATLLTTFAATLSYLFISQNSSPSLHTVGSIEVPAFLMISLGAFLSTPFGVTLSHSLPLEFIKRCFSAFLFLVGLYMWIS